MTMWEQIQQHLHEEIQRGLNDANRISGAIARAASEPIDPWVKVGTTTIDGSRAHVAAAFGCRPHDLGPVLAQAQGFACLVGGRMLRVSSYDLDDEMSIVHCDIVRRQSEIDAEGAAKQDEFNCAIADMEERDYPHGLPRPRCPECGPHGNRGKVRLASSWAKCTTCAGGKPGDVWGEVRTERPALGALAIGDLVFDHDVEVARGIPITTTVAGFYQDGDRVMDRWGRRGVVVGRRGQLVRVQMDEGWTGLHAACELVGKIGE